RYVRSQLLNAPADDFAWLLKWLRKPKNCEPPIYNELTRTPAMREKLEALTAGTRYLSPSQKMSRANQRPPARRGAEKCRKLPSYLRPRAARQGCVNETGGIG